MEDKKNTALSPLLTDLYQLTMAQGFFSNNKNNLDACFHLVFRDYPFGGGYAIYCGLAQVIDYVKNYKFDNSDIEYLKSLKSSNDKQMFKDEFLNYLSKIKLTVNIDSVQEGSIVFPNEPILRVTGPILQCQLLETALLNCVNFQTLVATKASRVKAAAQCPVMEFGLRRAQGYSGGVWASRAAVVGGCASTSNVEAGRKFGLPVAGTHSHSWVMSFDSELEAFRAYANEFPENCVLLVDTYDVIQGIENAIIVGKEMKQKGQKLSGIRLDSGDLSWLSKIARKMLDEAGLEDCGIVLSNDLDEYLIKSIQAEGGIFSSLGVGTKLSTAYDQPALGGVYKLSATKENSSNTWKEHIKISESVSKMTIPGVLNVKRYVDKQGKLAGDMIYDINYNIDNRQIIVDPFDNLRRKNLGFYDSFDLLETVVDNGEVVQDDFSVQSAKKRTEEGLKQLDETQRRTLNPHTYPVGLEFSLNERRNKMIEDIRGI